MDRLNYETGMKFAFSSEDPAKVKADVLAVPVFEEEPARDRFVLALDKALGGLVTRTLDEEHFKGKKNQSFSLHTHGKAGAGRLLFLGAGSRKELAPSDLRPLAARAVRQATSSSARSLAILLPELERPAQERAVQLVTEGIELGRYRFDKYLSDERRRTDPLVEATFVVEKNGGRIDGLRRMVDRGKAVAQAVARARDLVNEPAGLMTPRRMAEIAKDLARKQGLEVKVMGPKDCEKLGMGMFLGVAQGSDEEPRLIHLLYRPKGKPRRRLALIGKGVTFDSGGLSLKSTQNMEGMKTDMAGAAAVISAVVAAGELGIAHEVHAIAACTENMPSGKAYKLGDVLKSMAGKTVEINNTDAEGRLTLGDAITYAHGLEPDEILDFATLTGACVVALGPYTAGVMTNQEALRERFLAAARASGEDMWPLPLPDRLKEMLKSEIADMKNTGERYGGALTAGIFLREFAGETPWVHVDLAGPASTDKEWGHFAKGATGFAVATILEYLSVRE
jgi:leucyl aminopeptidase